MKVETAPLITISPAAAAGKPGAKLPLIRKPVAPFFRWRITLQAGFLLLNLWIGVQFYQWVRYYETAGATRYVERPAGVEGWLPIASLMNLKYFLVTGEAPSIHPAGMFLFATFLLISLLLRRAFCSWLCPAGTVSEWLWRAGKGIFGRTLALPKWLDIPLRGLKYLLLGLFLSVVATMSAAAIREFLDSPYGMVADVKMLDFFRYLTTTTAVVLTLLVAFSLLVPNFWCRYLCPYGALHGLAALVSPLRIRRNAPACIDCGQCSRICPSRLPVHRLSSVRSPECIGCLDCVAACPAAGALETADPLAAVRNPRTLAAAIVALFLLVVGAAKITGHWDTHLPEQVYQELIPRASEFNHP